jgi:L-ascorbate metabolism protein UlaG (beta-lactamase superfamily)
VNDSPNWRKGAFHNADKTPRIRRALGFLMWKLFDRRARRLLRGAEGAPRVAPNLARLHSRHFQGITWLGHATALIQLKGTNILTDPVWGHPRAYHCRIVPPPLPIRALPPLHLVLISHDHRDHLDARTVRALGRRPTYAVPLGVDRYFRRRRFPHVLAFDWWETREVGGVKVTFVPAHHWSRQGLTENRTLWGGWVIESPRATVYFSGDTARMPVLAEIGRRFPGIDYAILPVGAYEPEWFLKSMHMSPEEAVQSFLDLGHSRKRHLVPVHWGTMLLGDEPPTEPPARLRKEFARRRLPADALQVLAIGETIPVLPYPQKLPKRPGHAR